MCCEKEKSEVVIIRKNCPCVDCFHPDYDIRCPCFDLMPDVSVYTLADFNEF